MILDLFGGSVREMCVAFGVFSTKTGNFILSTITRKKIQTLFDFFGVIKCEIEKVAKKLGVGKEKLFIRYYLIGDNTRLEKAYFDYLWYHCKVFGAVEETNYSKFINSGNALRLFFGEKENFCICKRTNKDEWRLCLVK